MSSPSLSRRSMLFGSAGLAGTALLSACVTGGSEPEPETSPGATGGADPSAPASAVVLQSSLSDPAPRAALTGIVDDYTDGDVTLNTVAIEQYRAQLSTYLTSANPPDVLTWYAGSVARDYAAEGLLLDLSDMWTGDGVAANFSEGLRELSTADDGTQIFMPTNYYWWGIFYMKSRFEEWGVEPAETWDDFLAMCETLQGHGVSPLANGIGTTPWMASGWFDFLNLRVNGAEFHRELLAGNHSFDSAEVREVMDRYADLIPFFDPNMTSYAWQEAVTPLVQGQTGMYLVGAFISQNLEGDQVDDLDFFTVPTIDPSIPSAIEAPTDGYFASANSENPEGAKALMAYLAEAPQQQRFIEEAGSSNLPTSPDVDTSQFSPLVQKGLEVLENTEQITQFFNRDSSDALQTTADTALTQFLANPDDVDTILREWQTAAERVWES